MWGCGLCEGSSAGPPWGAEGAGAGAAGAAAKVSPSLQTIYKAGF